MGSLDLLYLVAGGLVGGIAVWLSHQHKFRHAEEQLEAAAETARQTFGKFSEEKQLLRDEIQALSGELSDSQEEAARQESELAATRKKLTVLSEVLEKTHVEYREMTNRLLERERTLGEVQLDNAKIPKLEEALRKQEAEMAAVQQQLDSLAASRDNLAQELEEEKRSLEECVIFVEGSHYLPGRVVRGLVAAARAA